MEKLAKRSDGIFETASGLFAVSLKRSSGSDGEHNWFDYRPQSWAEPIRIRWPARDEIAVIDHVYATTLFRLKYGTTITQAQADAWNARVDEVELLADAPALDPDAQPLGQAAGGAAALVPASTGESASGPAIDPESLPLAPTPEEIAEAAGKASLDTDPANTQEGLKIGTEGEENKVPAGEPDGTEEAPASLTPPEPSQEDQTGEGEEPKGKATKKRTLS